MINFNKKIQQQFNLMQQTGKLFQSKLTGREVFDIYLSAFTPENNPIFRDPASSEHNCNHCKNFIRRYGNIVAVDSNNKIITMFDIEDAGAEYQNSANEISKALKAAPIQEVFFETFNELNSLPYESCSRNNSVFRLGIDKNVKRYTKEEAKKFGVVKADEIRTFNHIHTNLGKEFVDMTGESVESIMAKFRSLKEVFKRAMDSISIDTLQLVRDLISQGSLLNGDAHLNKIEAIIPYKQKYDSLPAEERDNYAWVASYKLPIAGFGNDLIGTLCYELTEGKELNEACKAWNKRVDPANYMKATAPITQRQIEEAKQFVSENGMEDSFNRRLATIDDIKASEIKHMNIGKGEIQSVSVFDNVKSTSTRHKRAEFDNVEEVTIDKFMQDILPTAISIEVMLRNAHEHNMVTLTTAKSDDSKPIFKWSNNYSWTYNGNLAGKSEIKEAVKSRGGNVDGVMRISLAFPDTSDDYDLHVIEPNGSHIYYGNVRQRHNSSGMLDLDAQGVDGFQPAEKRVENVIYTTKYLMPKGEYQIQINNFSRRGMHTNFKLEIEIEGESTILQMVKTRSDLPTILVAIVKYNGREFEVCPASGIEVVESKTISKEIYGLQTNEFHKVNLLCLSPNHWGENNVGNKHYFFMLDKCKTPVSIRGFHNENLISDLLTHRKVMEVLGAKSMIEPADKQLSGLGFNATVRDELIVKVSGSHKRMIKIKF